MYVAHSIRQNIQLRGAPSRCDVAMSLGVQNAIKRKFYRRRDIRPLIAHISDKRRALLAATPIGHFELGGRLVTSYLTSIQNMR